MIFKHGEVDTIAEGARNLTVRPIGDGLHYVQEDVPEAISHELDTWLPTVVR